MTRYRGLYSTAVWNSVAVSWERVTDLQALLAKQARLPALDHAAV